MSNCSCEKCNKKHDCYDCQHHYEHDDCHHCCDCDCHHHTNHNRCQRFICDDDFRFNLGGLQGGLNFRLRQLIGCPVKIAVEGEKSYHATICFVGSDFVELEVFKIMKRKKKENGQEEKSKEEKKKKKKKHKHSKTIIMPSSSIKSIELKDECDCY